MVLIVSFVALAALWPEPRLQMEGWRPLPRGIGRVIASRPVDIACGVIGTFLLGFVVYAGLEGTQAVAANFTPTFIYVVFWLGLVPASVLFGDIFRAFNPWRAIGRGVAWIARIAARGELPAPLAYPERLGRWPAAAGLLVFAAMELVIADGNKPENLAIATLVYSAITFIAMAPYGVEAWTNNGEAFSVYFNLFSRLSIFEARDGDVGIRRPMSGLPAMLAVPGTTAVLCVMIGSVTFDGAAEAPLWTNVTPDLQNFFENLGLTAEHALEATFAVGLIGAILLIALLYRLGIEGARSVGGGFTAS